MCCQPLRAVPVCSPVLNFSCKSDTLLHNSDSHSVLMACSALISAGMGSTEIIDLTANTPLPPLSPLLLSNSAPVAPVANLSFPACQSLLQPFSHNLLAPGRPVSGVTSNDLSFYWQGGGAHLATTPPPIGQLVLGSYLTTGQLAWAPVSRAWRVPFTGQLMEMKQQHYNVVATEHTVVRHRTARARRGYRATSMAQICSTYTPNNHNLIVLQHVRQIWHNPAPDFAPIRAFVSAGAAPARWLTHATAATLHKAQLFVAGIGFMFADSGWNRPDRHLCHETSTSPSSPPSWLPSCTNFTPKLSALLVHFQTVTLSASPPAVTTTRLAQPFTSF